MVNPGLMSSKTDMWSTPQDLFDALDREFHFTLDVCATPENAKCKDFYSPMIDGLRQPWLGVCWMNPPYGREIGKWVQKAYQSSRAGAIVVCLLPARTDTRWWQTFVWNEAIGQIANEIRFLAGRIRFSGSRNCAPFPSAIVVFRSAA